MCIRDRSIHFTALAVWSGGDGAHFSDKHGAFLSSEVSFLERLAGGETLFLLRFFPQTRTVFHNKPVYLEQKAARAQLHLATLRLVLWRGIGDRQAQDAHGISDGFKFSWKLRSDRTSWEFVAIWQCLGNALSSSDLNCYSLYLQEFQPEAGILY